MGERPWCPRCGNVRVVKSGHARGKQRWLCRRRGYQFTRTSDGAPDAPVPEPTKRAAITLYGHGLSLRAVGKLLGTTGQSVLRWVCRYVDRPCPKPYLASDWGSGCHGQGRAGVGFSLEQLSEPGAELAIEDGATDLEQAVGALAGPAHLLRLGHSAVDQKVGGAFGQRSADPLPGTVTLGVIG